MYTMANANKKYFSKSFYQYILVSIIATLIDFLVFKIIGNLFLTYNWIHVLLSMSAGAIVSFSLLNFWVFKKETNESIAQKVKKFLAGQTVAFALSTGLIAVLVDGLHTHRMYSRIFVAIIVWIILYFYNNIVVFKNSK
jgi:putative flippase GtrA